MAGSDRASQASVGIIRAETARLTHPATWRDDAAVRSAGILAWLLVVVLAALAPAAYADPPDPTVSASLVTDRRTSTSCH